MPHVVSLKNSFGLRTKRLGSFTFPSPASINSITHKFELTHLTYLGVGTKDWQP